MYIVYRHKIDSSIIRTIYREVLNFSSIASANMSFTRLHKHTHGTELYSCPVTIEPSYLTLDTHQPGCFERVSRFITGNIIATVIPPWKQYLLA